VHPPGHPTNIRHTGPGGPTMRARANADTTGPRAAEAAP
jgi:hypothetical protein